MRAGISFVVIGFGLAGTISSAAAQYLPPQPPPPGYPPSAHYPYPASPPPPYQRADPYPDTAGKPYDDPYPPQPQPRIGDTPRQPPDKLGHRIGHLDAKDVERVDQAILIFLGLGD